LTTFNGHDLNPVWAQGDDFYFLSEEDGTLNVYKRSIDGSSKKQLTTFKNHPVRGLSAAAGTIVFNWDGEIYAMTEGQAPRKVEVNIVTDSYASDVFKRFRSSGATSFSVSPNGEEVAFIMRGDVYVTSTKYKTTKQITNTPEQERVVDFAPDGLSLVYDSERDGIWQLFTAKIKNSDEKSFAYCSEIVEEPLYKSTKPAFQPAYSPDGKEVAFLENRTELRVINLKTKQVRTALDGKYNYSYSDGDVNFEWSPDSKWFLANYIGIGGWNNPDIALVKADGSQVIDLTESGYADGNAKWVLDGKAMVWESDRNGYRSHGSWGSETDAYIMFFDGDAYDEFVMNEEDTALLEKSKKDKEDKEKDSKKDDKKSKKGKKDKKDEDKPEVKDLVFELDARKDRMVRLTVNSSSLGDFYLNKKGDKFYYVTSFEKDGDLWMHDLKKDETKIVSRSVGYGGLIGDKEGKNIFKLGRGGISRISLDDNSVNAVEFEAMNDYRPAEERQYIYNHAWQQVKDKFYDVNLHGVDWDMYREAYQKFLPHINNNYDFAELLSEILGELNASHTGGRYYAPTPSLTTGSLGAFYDETWNGDGLKISEILHRGPLSKKSVGVKAGEVILAIDGDTIKAGQDYYPLFEGKAGRKVRLTVLNEKGASRSVTVTPVDQGDVKSLLYRRWVEHNQAVVDSVSGGKIGYVHISGMNSPSYRTIFDELLGKYRNCDAVIVDTRYNGGGWLHNDVAILLSGKEYVRYSPRGQYIGSEPFTQWNKPSAMLVNEYNYSDAHGTPYTYQTLGIGEIIGAPIPGTMTAVWWETQVDQSLVFGIPQVTSLDRNGQPLENKQLNPDVVVYNSPADELKGYDNQLITATKRLLEQVKK
jgi:C-terminal processing protease CtpA/Prc/Tol biopolymer transport system component